MKFFYLLALAFILSSFSKAQITLAKQNKLIGKVKLSTSASYKAVIRLKKVEKGEKKAGNSQTQYDKRGNEIEDKLYMPNGDIAWKYTTEYDTTGNKIESNRSQADGNFDAMYTYKYDMQGNEIEKSSFKADGSLSWKKTYAYDLQGNKTLYKRYMANGDLKSSMSWDYTFDQQGNWTK